MTGYWSFSSTFVRYRKEGTATLRWRPIYPVLLYMLHCRMIGLLLTMFRRFTFQVVSVDDFESDFNLHVFGVMGAADFRH